MRVCLFSIQDGDTPYWGWMKYCKGSAGIRLGVIEIKLNW